MSDSINPNRDPIEGSTRSRAAEDYTTFRLAQLTILLTEIAPVGGRPVDLERLGYYDFLAANPFAVFGPDDELETARLHRAAFDERQLAYASTGTRFANRRRRLQHDIALLVGFGLAEVRGDGYGVSGRGAEFADALAAVYVDQYRESVRVVHSRLKRLSDPELGRSARGWLQTPSLVLDLYGSPGDPQQEQSVASKGGQQ